MDPKEEDLGSDVDAGLAEAFGPPDTGGTSILKRIERLTGVRSQLLLHDPPGEESPLTYVHRLEKDDEGAEDDSRYQIAGEIAKGGVGVVYKGRDRDLGRDVALKVLRRAHASSPEVFRRFVEEAQIGGQLQHPGIVPVYSLGLQPDGRPSFAMKLVKGRTLAAALKERKTPSDDRRTWLRVFERICQTLGYAHARGVIHRDLKPSNVMLGAFGEVLVVDWGFGKVLGRPEPAKPEVERTIVTTLRSEEPGSQSIAGSVMGTPAYMPPEQALGHVEDLDESTDVFALGAILCEVLTGKPPYVGDARDLLVMASQARLDDALARLDESDADPEITALAKRCLAPMRQDRPANASEVADAMGRLLTQAEERAQAAEVEAVEARSRSQQAKDHARAARRAKTLTMGVAAAVVAAIAIGGWLYVDQGAKDRERVARVRPQLEQTIEEVSRLRGEERWDEALAVALKAEHLANDLDRSAQTKAGDLVRETRERKALAEAEGLQEERDRTLLADLAEIDYAVLDDRIAFEEDFDATYAAAFRRYGVDLGSADPKEVGAAIRARGRSFAAEVGSALDLWSQYQRRSVRREGGTSPYPVHALATACDPDPVQNELRELVHTGRAEDLIAFASNNTVGDLRVRSLVLLGEALRTLDHPEQAIPILEGAVRRHPGDAALHQTSCRASKDAGRLEDALRHVTALLALRPKSALAHNLLGCVMSDQGEYEEAEAAFRTARQLHPSHMPSTLNLGKALYELGRLEEAVALNRELIAKSPRNAIPYANLAVALHAQGNVDEALENLHEALRIRPDYAPAHTSLGHALIRQGRIDEAIVACRRAIELDPESWVAHHNLGAALQRKGLIEEAVAAQRTATRLKPEAALPYSNLAQSLLEQGFAEDAVKALQKAVQLEPKNTEFLVDLSVALEAAGRFQEGIERCREALELDAEHVKAHFNIGVLSKKLGRMREAEAAFRTALRLDPEFLDARCSLADVWLETKRLQEAFEGYEAALDMKAEHARAHRGIGSVHEARGRLGDAVKAYRRAVECDSDYARAHQSLGTALMRQGEYGQAAAALRTAIRLDPTSAVVHYNLGTALYHLGDLAHAVEAFREASRLEPAYPEALCNLAHALTSLGRFEEAVEPMQKGHELGSQRPEWPYPSADWVESCERSAVLARRLPAVIAGEEVPANSAERLDFAEICFRTRRYAIAASLYAEAFEEEPRHLKESYHCDFAALSAIRAGTGPAGLDLSLSEAERASWRSQALTWLQYELQWKQAEGDRGELVDTLTDWLRETHFDSVRDEQYLGSLPAEDAEAWRAFWRSVREALADAKGEE